MHDVATHGAHSALLVRRFQTGSHLKGVANQKESTGNRTGLPARRPAVGVSRRYLGQASQQLQGSQRHAHIGPPLLVESLGDQVDTADQETGGCICMKSYDVTPNPHAHHREGELSISNHKQSSHPISIRHTQPVSQSYCSAAIDAVAPPTVRSRALQKRLMCVKKLLPQTTNKFFYKNAWLPPDGKKLDTMCNKLNSPWSKTWCNTGSTASPTTGWKNKRRTLSPKCVLSKPVACLW